MQMSEWGENNFIDWVKGNFLAPSGMRGIGDDCAVIPTHADKAWLVTTDSLIEEIHFLKDKISPFQLGYKTLMVNISDIAAMGGAPKFCFLSIGMPSKTQQNWVKEFIQGIRKACTTTNVVLLGGDTTGSLSSLFLNMVAIGEAELSKVKYRHKAKPGDILCVTNFLGDSGAGLRALLEEIPLISEVDYLITAHLEPTAHFEEGLWLGNRSAVNAMMDLSDGIEQDLSKLLKASCLGADVFLECLPLSQPLQVVAKQNNWDIYQLALAAGEDYCLMLTISPAAFPEIEKRYFEHFQRRLFQIGTLTDKHTGIVYYQDDSPKKFTENKEFNHFNLFS